MLALNCYCSCLAILLLITSSLSTPEEDALQAVKQSLVDPKTVMSTWNTDIVNPCNSWLHIECNEKDQIKSISLGSESLSGSLSPDIGKLPKLQTLQLQGNNLSGSLPSHLGNLTNLETLNVGHNMFSGSIPEELGQLKRLQNLDLSYNQLSGAIPGSIVFLSSTLKSIDISSNNLSGEIPKVLLQIPQFNFTGNNLNCSLNSTENPCERNNSAPLPSTASGLSKSSSTGAIAGGLIGGVSLIAISIIVFTVRKRQIQSQGDSDIFVDVAGEDDLQITFGQLRRFSWHELQVATGNYSDHNILGQGGFGRVYRGTLEDGLEIAVKRLKHNHSVEGETAFLREVEMICVAVHRNLLQLIGVCTTPSERLLVYPFMVNGSVADRLRDLKPGERALDWPTRKHIALGAARGLAYLHDHCNPKIIHRDVKAANVLLDIDFEPVVGDFGLAKVVDVGNTHVTTMVRGTMGHIAPEYLATGKSSEKTDVFGYGVMLLELVTGQRAIDFSRLHDEDDVLLLDHVKRLQQEERISLIVDPNMHVYEEQEVAELIQVALLCTQPKPEDRPKMGEVVKMLAGEGLAERWEEWQQAEVFRRQEYERIPRRLAEFVEDSFANQEAIELSSAR